MTQSAVDFYLFLSPLLRGGVVDFVLLDWGRGGYYCKPPVPLLMQNPYTTIILTGTFNRCHGQNPAAVAAHLFLTSRRICVSHCYLFFGRYLPVVFNRVGSRLKLYCIQLLLTVIFNRVGSRLKLDCVQLLLTVIFNRVGSRLKIPAVFKRVGSRLRIDWN